LPKKTPLALNIEVIRKGFGLGEIMDMLRRSLPIIALAITYFLAAELGQLLSLENDFATFWPAAGVAVCFFHILGRSWWPHLLAATAVATLTSDVVFHNKTIWISSGFWVANSTETLVAATLMLTISRWNFSNDDTFLRAQYVDRSSILESWQKTFLFILIPCSMATMVGAVLGASVLSVAFGESNFGELFLLWWSADAVGMMVAGSIGITIYYELGKSRKIFQDIPVVVCALLLLSSLAFYVFTLQQQPIVYLVFPPLFFLAIMGEKTACILGLCLVAIISVWGTSRNYGAFSNLDGIHTQAFCLQLYLTVCSSSVLSFTAYVQQQKQAEFQHRLQLQTILDSLDAQVFLKDTKNRILRANRAAAQTFGLTVDEIAGKNASQLFPQEHEQLWEDDKRLIASGKAWHGYPQSFQLPNDRMFIVESHKVPFFDDNGNAIGLVVVMNDLTQLRQAEAGQARQIQRLDRITASATKVTQAMQEGSGGQLQLLKVIADTFDCSQIVLLTFQHSIGVHWRSTKFHDSGQVVAKEVCAGQIDPFYETLLEPLQTKALALPDVPTPFGDLTKLAVGGLQFEGQTQGILIVGLANKDFSEDDLDLLQRISQLISPAIFAAERIAEEQHARRQAEMNLANSRLELERLSKINTIGEMTAGIAHELNQPLTALINFTDATYTIAQADITAESINEIRHLTKRSSEQACRAADVLRSVRQLIKQATSSYQQIEILSLLRESKHLVADRVEGTDASISIQCDQDHVYLDADRVQIQQVAINLMRNSLLSCKDASAPKIIILVEAGQSDVTLQFIDNGTGFSENQLNRLFDVFFSTRRNGLGLGLKICRSIVELHGGKIWARNQPNGGAVVGIELPRQQTTMEKAA